MYECRNEIFNDGAGYAMTQLHIQLAATATRWSTMPMNVRVVKMPTKSVFKQQSLGSIVIEQSKRTTQEKLQKNVSM